eukprot:tig00000743_g3851.t1
MSRHRNFCFTWNNPQRRLTLSDFTDATYLVYSEEVGASGTPHLQGYVEFSKAKRESELRKRLPTIHWEPRKGRQQDAIAYCKKNDATHVDGPFEFGEPKKQGERTDLAQLVHEIKSEKRKISEVALEYPDLYCRYRSGIRDIVAFSQPPRTRPTEIHIRWGPPGTGKTRFIYDSYGNSEIYKKPEGPWWDGYENQPIVLIDDYDGYIPFTEMLQLCDRYPHKVPIKGGFVEFNSTAIYITSNVEPRSWYLNIPPERYAAFERRVTSCAFVV